MEVSCEALARQSTVALFQLWVPALSHMGVSLIVVVSYGHYLGRCTVCLVHQRSSAYFDLSICLYPVRQSAVYHFSVDLIGWPIRLPALLFPAPPPFRR